MNWSRSHRKSSPEPRVASPGAVGYDRRCVRRTHGKVVSIGRVTFEVWAVAGRPGAAGWVAWSHHRLEMRTAHQEHVMADEALMRWRSGPSPCKRPIRHSTWWAPARTVFAWMDGERGFRVANGGPVPWMVTALGIDTYKKACVASGHAPHVTYIRPVYFGDGTQHIRQAWEPLLCNYFSCYASAGDA